MELVGSTMRAIITAVLIQDINKFNLLNLPFKHKASTLTESGREQENVGLVCSKLHSSQRSWDGT